MEKRNKEIRILKQQQKYLFEKLKNIAEKYENTDEGINDVSSEIYKNFSLETKKGREFYSCISDELLLDILRQRGETLGYSPGQKEVFWVWRSYIKKRFQKWPYALCAAGLSKAAGRGGKPIAQVRMEEEEYRIFLEKVRLRAKELCRIPHPQEIPRGHGQIEDYSVRWNKVLKDAGIDSEFFYRNAVFKVDGLEEDLKKKLEQIKKIAADLHRPPLKSELPEGFVGPLIKKMGSYRNVLYQIDLEPIEKKSPFYFTNRKGVGGKRRKTHLYNLEECCYQIVAPDGETQKDLFALYDISKKIGNYPNRKQVDIELRKRLQKSCGTWSNALYQIKFMEKNKIKNLQKNK